MFQQVNRLVCFVPQLNSFKTSCELLGSWRLVNDWPPR